MKILLHIIFMFLFVNHISAKPPKEKYYDIKDTLTYNKHITEEIAKYNFCQSDTNDVVLDVDSLPFCFNRNKVELIKFIVINIHYPALARENSIQGKVVTRFIINENGEICNFQILDKKGFGLDEESIRVISLLPKWQPALKNNKPVKSFFILPVSYKIN
jgi:TonB family protein